MYLTENLNYHLISAKKLKGKKNSYYLLTSNRKVFQKHSEEAIGKLKSNFKGTEYQIFERKALGQDKEQLV